MLTTAGVTLSSIGARLGNGSSATDCGTAAFASQGVCKSNVKLMRAYLTAAGIEFEVRVIAGTLHDMQTFQGLNGDNWDWPKAYWNWRTQPEIFLNSIIDFIHEK